MIFIIVGTKTIRFLVDDSTYLDYMIGKLNIVIFLIVIYRANVKIYIDYKAVQKRIKTHELSFIRKAVTNKKKRLKKIVGCSVIDPEIQKAILEIKKNIQATKEANVKKTTRKKDQSAKKKIAAEIKKIIIVANRVTNKIAKAAEEAAAKKNLKNNRKGKKADHLQNIKGLEDAIQYLFLKPNNKARIIGEKNVVK